MTRDTGLRDTGQAKRLASRVLQSRVSSLLCKLNLLIYLFVFCFFCFDLWGCHTVAAVVLYFAAAVIRQSYKTAFLLFYEFLRRIAKGDEIHPRRQRFNINLLTLGINVTLQQGLSH